MRSLLVALALAGGAEQVPPLRPPPDPSTLGRPGDRYGEAEGATLAGLDMAPEACHGEQVIVKGRLDLLEHGRYWQLVDGSARALLLASFGMNGSDFDRMIGAWVEVRGVCRPIKPKEYMQGVDVDTIEFPDLPPLPAPAPDRPRVSITVFSVADAGGPGREGPGAETAIMRTVLNDPSGFVGVNVRVIGLFRGRNLFGDLPAASQRNPADWVLKENDAAMWVTGRPPRGKGWSLDPGYKGDAVRWIAVEGKVEVVNGVAYLKASKLTLTRDPRARRPRRVSVPRPRLALTVGDPAGIGPEIVLRALAASERPYAEYVVYGPADALRSRARRFGLPCPGGRVVDVGGGDVPGRQVIAAAGDAAADAVLRAAADARAGRLDAIVTAPLNKELHAAGHPWPGHTEMLAEAAGASDVAMMFVGGGLRVALLTIHHSLRSVPDAITRGSAADRPPGAPRAAAFRRANGGSRSAA